MVDLKNREMALLVQLMISSLTKQNIYIYITHASRVIVQRRLSLSLRCNMVVVYVKPIACENGGPNWGSNDQHIKRKLHDIIYIHQVMYILIISYCRANVIIIM